MMMMSISPSFFGFNTAQRALMASQAGLNIVNHNISNANTDGYTRQRLDLSSSATLSPPISQGKIAFQLGQGVDITGVTRTRDSFLDNQYQQELGTQGELTKGNEIFTQLESVVGEPSSTGLANSVQQLFASVSDMRNNPQSLPARTAFIQKMVDLTQVIQNQGKQLIDLHKNLVGTAGDATSFPTSQLGIAITDFNSKLASIADYNKQINTITSSGATPNDLLDKRNQLVEQLSTLADIDVTPLNGEQIQISLGGRALVRGPEVLDTLSLTANTGINANPVPALVSTTTGGVNITNAIKGGTVKGILDLAGNNTAIETVYGVYSKLSAMFESLTSQFNTVQQAGRDLTGTQHPLTDTTYGELFNTDSTYSGSGPKLLYLKVNPNFKQNPDKISLAANDTTIVPSGFAGVGDSRNAKAMADIQTTAFVALNNSTPETFHQSLVARLGTDSRSYQDRLDSQKTVITSLEGRRQSVSGVNLDEESINLLKYQRSFEAASRMVKAFNEIYQSILNMV
ncbi:MAG: flagellar hook-associated protein FlgK [Candidatus Melainabacteria bacterium]|nr:flagellar hook-associated protein FlgK [Candidatus Melainabacteria bacterium]